MESGGWGWKTEIEGWDRFIDGGYGDGVERDERWDLRKGF